MAAGETVIEIVEALSEAQVEQVRILFREYQAALAAQYRAPALEAQLASLPGVYGPPKGKLLLAMVAGELVGCVGLRPFPLAGACEMKHLYVRPAFRGQGVGKVLAERVVQEARALGYSRVRLDTHPPTMQSALAMYRKLGFEEVAPGPVPQVEGLLYMELLLTIEPESSPRLPDGVPPS